MLIDERRKYILDCLRERSSVLVSDICDACNVFAVTVRNDLDYLEGEGLLKRTHGGAVAVSEYVVPEVSKRMRKNAAAKHAIALAAAELVSDGDQLLVGSGPAEA